MSKRNLAKTAIEGGRRKTYRERERYFNRAERRASRCALRVVATDPSLADEVVIKVPGHEHWGRDFADKLNPVKRWLYKQVGRPWNKVYSEVRQRFDFRTTPGRHIVDHIFGWVNRHRQVGRSYRIPLYDKPWNDPTKKEIGYRIHFYQLWELCVDSRGILREAKSEDRWVEVRF